MQTFQEEGRQVVIQDRRSMLSVCILSLLCFLCTEDRGAPLAPPLNLPTKMVIVSKHNNFHRTFLKMTFIDLDILDVLLQTLVMCGIS